MYSLKLTLCFLLTYRLSGAFGFTSKNARREFHKSKSINHYQQRHNKLHSSRNSNMMSMISREGADRSAKVAVIGAGAAGLAAARIFQRHGFEKIKVLEQSTDIGGIWKYYKSDERPMYRGLRTNLPKEIMAFREKPWLSSSSSSEQKSYVTHQQVYNYLKEYASDFDLEEKYINFGCSVTQLQIINDSIDESEKEEKLSPIKLEWTTSQDVKKEECFDLVVICNGHYCVPSFPTEENIKGLQDYSGTIKHSLEYDDPSVFKDKNVLCIGGRASGSDLAREISEYASTVYLSDSTCVSEMKCGNVYWVPKTKSYSENKFHFDHDCQLAPDDIDYVVCCSGYDYNFAPFINKDSNMPEFSTGNRRVGLLYKQLWYAPQPALSFVGIPHSVVPFPLFELQVEAIVAQFLSSSESESYMLPPRDERLNSAMEDYETYGNNKRIQDTHFLGSNQWSYLKEMAEFAGNLNQDIENYIHTQKVSVYH